MKLRPSNHSVILSLAFVVAVAVIYYCHPVDNERAYNYEVNRPWNYSLLTAPFDIPIHHDSISAQAIKDSIDSQFEPVFLREKEKENAALETYLKRLADDKQLDLGTWQRQQLDQKLRKIFDAGIIDQDTRNALERNHTQAVRMLNGNTTMAIPVSQFYTQREAYAALDSLLKGTPLHNVLGTTRITDVLIPNMHLDTLETDRFRNEAYQLALAPIGVVQQGERIIDKGDIVTTQLYTILGTYEQLAADRGASVGKNQLFLTLGYILYLTILFTTLYTFLYFFRRDYFDSVRTMLFLMILITTFAVVTFLMSGAFTTGIYIVPLTIVPVVVLIFLDSRTAFFTYMITILICLTVARFPVEYAVLQFVAGLSAIITIKELSKRSQLLRTAIYVFAVYAICYVAIDLMQTGLPSRLSAKMFGSFAINSIFISFAYILVFVLEKLFGFTSRVTLVEMSDINSPLLRELSEECPGTFQHAMAVSNLATAAAHRIGANVQLVRAGALYHDIGKITNPAFFTENQHGVNPHDALNPLQSARIVIGHVTEGVKRAEKAKLPSVIKDFILEHHGKGKARYFYNTYCNAHPGEKVDEKPFTYPGPNPRSRETSILMMADAVEAASRSLKDHSVEAIGDLVDKIVDQQVAEGLHNDSPISFRDVNEIKDVFKSRLRTLYHSRISYPEVIKPSTSTTENAQP